MHPHVLVSADCLDYGTSIRFDECSSTKKNHLKGDTWAKVLMLSTMHQLFRLVTLLSNRSTHTCRFQTPEPPAPTFNAMMSHIGFSNFHSKGQSSQNSNGTTTSTPILCQHKLPSRQQTVSPMAAPHQNVWINDPKFTKCAHQVLQRYSLLCFQRTRVGVPCCVARG